MSTDAVFAQLFRDVLRILVLNIRDRNDTHLFRRKPHREVARVMLDQESNHALMRTKWRTVNTERHFIMTVLVCVFQIKAFRDSKINLIRSEREFASNR